jgi:hypothetical protein
MAEDDAAQAMLQWAVSQPPAELATELMAAFGPDGQTGTAWRRGHPAGNDLRDGDLVKWLFRGYPPRVTVSSCTGRYWRPCNCWSMPNCGRLSTPDC